MGGYKPKYIAGMSTGLVQSRPELILPDDAYPILQNAYVWRERIKRKQGFQLLGRLRRLFTGASLGNSAASPWTFNVFSLVTPPITEADAQLELGSIEITIGAIVFTDQGNGTLTSVTPGNSGIINYASGDITLTHTAGIGVATTADFNYFPSLPVMGLLSRELNSINNEQTIAFDQTYAYRYTSNGWQEFIPGTTWTGNDDDFFWSTNYWVSSNNLKLFWVTNFSGTGGDPIRYTDGVTWTDFAPTINAGGDVLAQCLALLPFRGRLLAFNTLEGPNLANSDSFPQRIRWSAIGSPLTANSWRDDIRGQGGFLDIPTAESIVCVGFVRDNLVIYCERSTWQLRYTGRSISPFQIEKVNTELGAESTFSAVQFDTSLVGIGDKGVVECDSFKSDRIDIKIPDLVFSFNNENEGPKRVYGIRDFVKKLAYWTYPYVPEGGSPVIYPNRRLVYNYENDSWAIFTDSLTCLGTFQPPSGRTWENTHKPWRECNFPWVNRPALILDIIGGNQQGYVEYLDQTTTNDVSLFIKDITGNTTTATVINSPNHNLQTNEVIQIKNIPTGTPFASSLNDNNFGVQVIDADNIALYVYDPVTKAFTLPQLDAPGDYVGGGEMAIRDNFIIQSKKFNFAEQGENIQMGYVDVLMDSTPDGAISLYVYLNYNNDSPVNTLPQNVSLIDQQPDEFFNTTVPTTSNSYSGIASTKYWQRVYCPVRGTFITLVWTLSNLQLIGVEQENDVQIDAQILWLRTAGRLSQI
jgi:hypothetical protein